MREDFHARGLAFFVQQIRRQHTDFRGASGWLHGQDLAIYQVTDFRRAGGRSFVLRPHTALTRQDGQGMKAAVLNLDA